MQSQLYPKTVNLLGGKTAPQPNRLTSILRFVVITYLLGMVILSVEQFLSLPSNLGSVDFWNLLFLPVCWWYLLHTRQAVRFPYILGMWFILLGSFIGTFFSFDPIASFIFLAKEIYLYFWFVTVTLVLTSLEPTVMRRVVLAWATVVVLHGMLLVAEFISPEFYGYIISILDKIGNVDVRYLGRPAGLFENPVWAALFQLMGFVPLLLADFRRELTLLLGIVLLLSILATASLGALSALLGALAIAVLLLLLMGGHMKFLIWLATVAILAAVLFVFTIIQSPDVLARLEHLTTDRAAHTAGERLDLWGSGAEILFSPKSILGVGPSNYRDFFENKTLHNDFLEFGVERGVIGLLGLAIFTGEAWNNATKVLLSQIKSGSMTRPNGVIFIAMLFGILLESNAHQIFHFRSIWLALALLETTHLKMTSISTEAVTSQGEGGSEKSQPSIKLSSQTDRIHGGRMVVEFIGSTGAGKTTVINEVFHRLAKTSQVTTSIDLATSMLGLRGVKNPTLQNLAMEFVSFPFFIFTLYKYNKFLRHTIKIFWRATGFSIQTIHNLRSLVRKIGMYEITKYPGKNQVVLVDEGPVLAAHMFVPAGNTYTPEEITRFTELLPLPDLIVYIRASVDTIIERTHRRADPPREVEINNPDRMEAYIKRTVDLFDQITQADNLQPRLLVVESHDMADPGFDKVIDNIYQEILDRSSQQKKSNS
jgi:O-antigen ligase/thymidylate kinase